MNYKDNLEKLAELEHTQWQSWMKYMLRNLTPENIEKWKRQIKTPYKELTELEKESDRKWAQKVLDLLNCS
jgi:predicted RNase H-like nuclease